MHQELCNGDVYLYHYSDFVATNLLAMQFCVANIQELWHMYHEFSHSCTQNFLPGENAGGAPVHVQPQPGKGTIGEG